MVYGTAFMIGYCTNIPVITFPAGYGQPFTRFGINYLCFVPGSGHLLYKFKAGLVNIGDGDRRKPFLNYFLSTTYMASIWQRVPIIKGRV